MYLDDVKSLLGDVLALSESTRRHLTETTPLLGNLPELDSMAVVDLITAMEERFGITIGDDEIGASTFATLGSLANFVSAKRA
jgi:acyl carrier protein